MKIIVVGATHGHEKIGLRVISELKKLNIPDNQLELIIGNPHAEERNVPFTDSDLNRVFPGKADGTYEERRAYELHQSIVDADLVIDIHSTNTTDLSDDSMIIVTKYDEKTAGLIKLFRPPKVLVMSYKGQNALISDAKVGVAFEYGLDDSPSVFQATLHDICVMLVHFGIIKFNPYTNPRSLGQTHVYTVYDAFKKNFNGEFNLSDRVKNFSLIKSNQIIGVTDKSEIVTADEDFVPILFGRNRYKDILGFKACKSDIL